MPSMERFSGTIHTFEGRSIRVRQIKPGDWKALKRFHRALSEETIEQRMFESMPELSDERAHDYCDVDGNDRLALIAIDPDAASEIIGVVRFDRERSNDSAEYSAVVTDRWQRQGVGLELTVLLVEAALDRRIDSFQAYVRHENYRMLALLRNLGLPQTESHEAGVEVINVDIASRRKICTDHPRG